MSDELLPCSEKKLALGTKCWKCGAQVNTYLPLKLSKPILDEMDTLRQRAEKAEARAEALSLALNDALNVPEDVVKELQIRAESAELRLVYSNHKNGELLAEAKAAEAEVEALLKAREADFGDNFRMHSLIKRGAKMLHGHTQAEETLFYIDCEKLLKDLKEPSTRCAEAEVERLREALRFYASSTCYPEVATKALGGGND